MKTGKSGGYRLFYIADTYNSKIILVYIYPKTGSKGKTDIEHDLYQTMIDDYTDSLVNNELIPFNV